jgi:hypothetical protein
MGLQLVPQRQQFAPVPAQFAGQLRGADALSDAAQDQQQFRTGAPRAGQARAGEQVEHPPATSTLVIDQRIAVAAMHTRLVVAAIRTGQAAGVQQGQQFLVARTLVHEVLHREVHRLLHEQREPFCPNEQVGDNAKSTAWAT